jgi:hypothetical protein
MDSGFKRFFLRRSSKSKAILIGTPVTDSFRRTAGYNEFAAGPPPTIGSRPIKPSEEKVERKSFTHIRTRSVGPKERRHLGRKESDARPRTAPGNKPTPINPSDPSNFGQRGGAAQENASAPNVPELPKRLSGMVGPKHSDLIQAAVSKSKATDLPEVPRPSFDLYNEGIATRNSMYGKSPVNEDAAKPSSTHEANSEQSTRPKDAQRASFDAMRASRDAEIMRIRIASEKNGSGIERIRSAHATASDFLSHPVHAHGEGPKWSMSEPTSPKGNVTSANTSENRRSKRQSVGHILLQPQQSPQQPSVSAPQSLSKADAAAHPTNISSTSNISTSLDTRARSKSSPAAPTQGNDSNLHQLGDPIIPTLHPSEDESTHSASHESMPNPTVPRTLNSNQAASAHRNLVSALQPPDISANHVPPRTSSDRSEQKHEENKRYSRDLIAMSINGGSEGVTSVRSASQKQVNPSRRVMDLTVDRPKRKLNGGYDNDYDIGNENGVAQQADHVHILRAAVLSANSFEHKRGDDVVLGRVIHHRPSRSLSQIDVSEQSASVRDVGLSAQSDTRASSSASMERHSSTASTTSSLAIQSQLNRMGGAPTSVRHLQPPFEPVTAAASLEVPPREPAEARTSVPKSGSPEKSVSFKDHFQSIESEALRPPPLRSRTAEASPSTVPVSNMTSLAPAQAYSSVPSTNGGEVSTPQFPEVVTRDFAEAQRPPRVPLSGPAKEFQSRMTYGTTPQAPRRNKSTIVGSYSSARKAELDRQSSELDRSIAFKKQAAAKALLKLQEVMAMPTWEQAFTTSSAGPTRASTTTTTTTVSNHHWRNLSIEDGGPIAPSAIFQKVRIPYVTPPVSIHSTFFGHQREQRALSPSVEEEEKRGKNGIPEETGPSAPSSPGGLSDTSYYSARAAPPAKNNSISNATATAPPPTTPDSADHHHHHHHRAAAAAGAWQPERRGRSAAAASPHVKGSSHSRMGSAVSAVSGTSAYSLPYHMVPARGSSMRDSGSGSSFGEAGDIGVLPRFDIGQLGWQ